MLVSKKLVLAALCLSVVRCSENEKKEQADSATKQAFKFVSGFFGFDEERENAVVVAKGLSVIGAGFSRTGTKSLETALMRLGHKIYDTRSMLENKHVARWELGALEWRTNHNLSVVEALLEEMEAKGYTATLDFPMNLFALSFAELRPTAKVLFSVRPSDESWLEAWETVCHILSIFVCRPWSWFLDMQFPKRLLITLFDFHWIYPAYPEDISRPVPWFEIAHNLPHFATAERRAEWIALHRRFRLELETTLPADRLLVFDVREGWAPLLQFLGVQDPQLAAEAFPRVNDRASLQTVRLTMDVLAAGLPLWAGLLLGIAVLCVRCICCRGRRPALPPKQKHS